MGTFNKLKKSHKSSHLDEKIEFLNKELEKTGVISETPANSTASIYNVGEYVPAVPEVNTPIPDPDGVRDDDWAQDLGGGDFADPDTYDAIADAISNTDWLYNSNEVNGVSNRCVLPSAREGDVTAQQDIGRFGTGGGLVRAHVAHGDSLGYIGTGGIYQGLTYASYWGYMIPPRHGDSYRGYSDEEMDLMQSAYNKMVDMDARGIGTKRVYFWYPWSYFWFGGSYETYSGVKKNGYVLKGGYIYTGEAPTTRTQDYVPPGHTTIFSAGLGDSNYYPGPVIKGFMDFIRGTLDVGEKAFEYLKGEIGRLPFQPLDKLGDAAADVWDAALEAVGGITGAITDLTKGDIEDGVNEFKKTNAFEKIALDGKVLADFLTGDLKDGSIDNEYLGQNNINSILSGKNAHIAADGTFVAGDNLVGTGKKVSAKDYNAEKGTYTFRFGYDFNDNATEASKENKAEWQQVLGSIVGGKYGLDSMPIAGAGYAIWIQKLRGMAKKTEGHTIEVSISDLKKLNRNLYNGLVAKDIIPLVNESKVLEEGWESPKHVGIDKDEKKRWFKEKDIAPIYPKKAPPKLVRGYHPDMLPKLDTPIPYLKVKKKDLIRAHKLTDGEAQHWINIINRLNDYIMRNPDKLAYARERYPKNDPRLAELNYKMDMQLAAADDYIEKQFPENIRLYNKVVDATKKSIKLSDPKTFKSEKGVFTTFNKLARVQHVDNVYQPKERTLKLKKRTKNSVNRFLFKPKEKTKDDILKDKLAVLDKEMQKTMPDT